MIAWPATRPVSYDADKVFKESNDTWSTDPAILDKTGGRYQKRIVVVNSSAQIYFGAAE